MRAPAFLLIAMPYLLWTRFRSPWWQTFLVAFGASLFSQLVWWVARKRPARLAAAIGGALGTAAGSAWVLVEQSRAVPYYVEADAVAADPGAFAGRRLRVHGYAAPGSIRRGPDGLELALGKLPVRFAGVAPETLRDGMDVVAAGRLAGGSLAADQLLVKCPDNYDRGKGAKPF